MTNQDTIPRKKAQKYFFDLYDFSPEAIQKALEAEQAPPSLSFNEQELEAAKNKAYEEGKRDGLDEAAKQREHHVASLTAKITENFSALFQEEGRRLALYEEETIQLSLGIFKKLFPVLNKAGGLDEVVHVVSTVLKNQQACPEIVIEVQPDYMEDIQIKIDEIFSTMHNAGKYTVKANEALADGDCLLFWNDGGAIRNHVQLTQEIEKHLQEALADKASVQDNGNMEIRSDTSETVDHKQSTYSTDGDRS